MIRYRLKCKKGHEFDAWFASSAAYDKQAKRKLVECPDCGSTQVDKAIMAPALSASTKKRRSPQPVPAESTTVTNTLPPEAAAQLALQRQMLAAMRKIRDEVVSNADNVGEKFAEEARKIHYREVEPRGIYGQATDEEARALHDEGIEFHPLPVLPDDHN